MTVDYANIMQKNNEAVETMVSGKNDSLASDMFRECLMAIKAQIQCQPTSHQQVDDSARSERNRSSYLDQIRGLLSFHPAESLGCPSLSNKRMNDLEGFVQTRPLVFVMNSDVSSSAIMNEGDHIIGVLCLAVATFNAGLLHHVRGKSTANIACLRKAQQLYLSVSRLLSANNPLLLRGLFLVTTNNYCQICLDLGDEAQAERVASRVWLENFVQRQQQENLLPFFRPHELDGIQMNMFALSFSAKYGCCAPVA